MCSMDTNGVVQCGGSENVTEGKEVSKEVEYAIPESSLSGELVWLSCMPNILVELM